MCRTVLHVGREIPVTLALRHLIEHSFPEEYEARRQEENGWSCSSDREAPMPLFVMTCILPGLHPFPLLVLPKFSRRKQELVNERHKQRDSPACAGERMRLNVFEPRYRLMIRRCMEGSRKFGMALVSSRGELHKTACEVEIVDCQPAPDGRYLLAIEGRRRFTLARSWEQVHAPYYASPLACQPPQHQY